MRLFNKYITLLFLPNTKLSGFKSLCKKNIECKYSNLCNAYIAIIRVVFKENLFYYYSN